MNKKREYIEANEEKVKEIAFRYSISETIARVLYNRGITEEKAIEKFLHPNIEKLNDPFLFTFAIISTLQFLGHCPSFSFCSISSMFCILEILSWAKTCW